MQRNDTDKLNAVALEATSAARRPPLRGPKLPWLRHVTGMRLLILVFGLMLCVFAFILRDTGFLTVANFLNIVRQTTVISVMAVATVFVLSAGEIDLSFASVVALAALVGAQALERYGIPAAVLSALGVGAVIGFINGAITVGLRIPSFIVTLGTMGAVSGVARWVTNLQSVPVMDNNFAFIFGSGNLGQVPVLLFWTVAAMIVGEYVLRRTSYGRKVLATGGSERAARYSGIRTGWIKISVLVISGLGGALGGLLYTGWLYGARYDLGSSDLISVLAAVIIGGTALNGGKGSIIGAVIGSLLMGTINNALVLMGLSTAQQDIFRGLIIVLAVALSGRSPLSR